MRISDWSSDVCSSDLALEAALGPLSWADVDLDRICDTLDKLMNSGRRIYSAAYIMPSPRYGHARKHANHLALIAHMMEQRLPQRLQQLPSLEADRKSTRLNSSHYCASRMPSSA